MHQAGVQPKIQNGKSEDEQRSPFLSAPHTAKGVSRIYSALDDHSHRSSHLSSLRKNTVLTQNIKTDAEIVSKESFEHNLFEMLRDFRINPANTLADLKKQQKEMLAIQKACKNSGRLQSPSASSENKSQKEICLEYFEKAISNLDRLMKEDFNASLGYPSLSMSLSLSLAARDLALDLGQLSIVAAKAQSLHHHHANIEVKEDQLCYKKLKRYAKDTSNVRYLGEIILYSTHNNHLSAFAQILSQYDILVAYLKNPHFVLVGIAHAHHNSVDDCVVVTFSDKALVDDPKEITKFIKATEQAQAMAKTRISEQIEKLKKINVLVAATAKFMPKDHGHHLPPNEEEDLGLETIAKFMVQGGHKSPQSQKQPTMLKPYEMINLIAGGGPNQPVIKIELFKNYMIENFIITDVHVVKRVIDRIKSKKKHLEGNIDVKKFDAIIKPYVIRVKKHLEIQLALANLKKQIFERDYTLSDFFRVCQNMTTDCDTSQKTYFNSSSSPNVGGNPYSIVKHNTSFKFSMQIHQAPVPTAATSMTKRDSFGGSDYQLSTITRDQFLKGIHSLGNEMSLNDFNNLISAFRITKSQFLERADYMSVLNKISVVPNSNKTKQARTNCPSVNGSRADLFDDSRGYSTNYSEMPRRNSSVYGLKQNLPLNSRISLHRAAFEPRTTNSSLARIGIKKNLEDAASAKSRDISIGESTSKISMDKQKLLLADQSKTNPVMINSVFDNYESMTPYEDSQSVIQSQKNSVLPNSITLHQLFTQKSSQQLEQKRSQSRPKTASNFGKINQYQSGSSLKKETATTMNMLRLSQNMSEINIYNKMPSNVSPNQSINYQNSTNGLKSIKNIKNALQNSRIALSVQRPMSSYTNTNAQLNNRTAPKRRIRKFNEENDQEGVFTLGESSHISVGQTPAAIDQYFQSQQIALNSSFSKKIQEYSNAPISHYDLAMSASKQFGQAKKLIQTNYGFKMDFSFQGPIAARSIGGKIYNGPGKNHDVLGRLTQDGIINIVGRTEDRIWLNIKCGEGNKFEGWVLASDIDMACDRKMYQHHDTLSHADAMLLAGQGKIQVTALRDLVLRQKPKWSSHALTKVPVNSELMFVEYDETKQWAQVTFDGRDNPFNDGSFDKQNQSTLDTNVKGTLVSGWVTIDQLSNLHQKPHQDYGATTPERANALKASLKPNKPIQRVNFTPHNIEFPGKTFEKYEHERLQRSFLRDQVEGEKYDTLKSQAVNQIRDLHNQTNQVDQKIARRQQLLSKFVSKMMNQPLVQAFKKWNWQKTQLKQLLKNHREAVRDKYIEVTKDRQNNISTLRTNIETTNRQDKEAYETQYNHEMKSISNHENELQKLMTIRAQHLKESNERKLEISQARVALERQSNAAQIREEDLQCDYKYTQSKINQIIANRKLVLAATALKRPKTNRVTVSMLNRSLLNGVPSADASSYHQNNTQNTIKTVITQISQ